MLLASPPEKGEDFQLVADDYQKFILPGLRNATRLTPSVDEETGLTHWQHPSFFAYYPTACTFEGMLADLYASSACNPGFNVSVCALDPGVIPADLNVPVIKWICSPACTELEVVVCDWAAKLLGLDKAFWNESQVGGGVIQASAHFLLTMTAIRS